MKSVFILAVVAVTATATRYGGHGGGSDASRCGSSAYYHGNRCGGGRYDDGHDVGYSGHRVVHHGGEGGYGGIVNYGGYRGGVRHGGGYGGSVSYGGYRGGVRHEGGHGGTVNYGGYRGGVRHGGGYGGSVSYGGYRGGVSHGVAPVPAGSSGGNGVVDLTVGHSDYHFSWRHDGNKKYDWEAANAYCSKLGSGWYGVSIETTDEDAIISEVIAKDKLAYIWTGGFRKGGSFVWPSGSRFYGLNWSFTGSLGKPQPDNAENGQENGLAVLNDFYNDGIKWHDVAFHHEKPIVCERASSSVPSGHENSRRG